jgi:hypothetical protein
MPQFDGIEANKDLLSGEASLEMTPSGMFLQSTWNQWQETDLGEVYNSDAWYRRILFLDEIENPNKAQQARRARRSGPPPPLPQPPS